MREYALSQNLLIGARASQICFRQKNMKSIVLVAALSFSAAFAAFWILYGKDLAWDVSANGSYWYSEDFSTRGKIIVTSAFSALIAAVAVGLSILVKNLRKKSENAK